MYTNAREVNAMLDLVKFETERIESRFLEPACGTGNFLVEILRRKLVVVEDKYKKSQHEYERNAVTAISSIYGIDILADNVLVCQTRLFDLFNAQYSALYKNNCKDACRASVRTILHHNILHGDALTLHTVGENPHPIVFADNMKFDVIIGNPPYQLSDGGNGASASPIYQRFVEQAKKLNPRYLSMIIPSRWFAGGKGLDDFRVAMLNDSSISKLVDYPNAKECFPNNSIGGGVCYFLRDLAHKDKCEVVNVLNGQENSKLRKLNQFDVFVRYNQAISIIQKIRQNEKTSLQTIVSSRNPFGFSSKDRGEKSAFKNAVMLFTSQGRFYVNAVSVLKGNELVKKHKVMISKVTGEHAGEPDKGGMFKVLSRTELLSIDEICTDSYLCIGSFDGESEAKNLLHYLATRFVRFLLLQAVTSINLSADKFAFIPMQNFNEPWTDEKLYAKYGLSLDEIAFIESMIRPMDLAVVANDAINDAVEVDDE